MTVDGNTIREALERFFLFEPVDADDPLYPAALAAVARLEAENTAKTDALTRLADWLDRCDFAIGKSGVAIFENSLFRVKAALARAALGLEGSERDRPEAGGHGLGAVSVAEDSE